MTKPPKAFHWAIDPISDSTFFAEYWEKKPLVISRNITTYFTDLISMSAVDEILSSTGLRVPGFRLIREGSQIPTSEYTRNVSMTPGVFDGLLDLNKVAAQYANGATVVLQALERSWLPLITFCKDLEKYLGHPVQANLYLTPKSAQGFAAHFDTHDTLILQVEGRKKWKIYDAPFPLPLSKHKYSKDTPHGPAEPDFVLEAGDTLYMPRGIVHEALTADSYSLHITIGIKVLTWFDIVSKVVNRALAASERDVNFRQALPLRFAQEDSITSAEMSKNLEHLIQEFIRHLGSSDAKELMTEQFVSTRWPYRQDQIQNMNRLSTLSLDSYVTHQENIIFRVKLDHAAKVIRLAFHGKMVVFPSTVSDAVIFVVQTESFRSRDIPGNLDEAGKLILVKRLIREGFLTIDHNTNGSR